MHSKFTYPQMFFFLLYKMHLCFVFCVIVPHGFILSVGLMLGLASLWSHQDVAWLRIADPPQQPLFLGGFKYLCVAITGLSGEPTAGLDLLLSRACVRSKSATVLIICNVTDGHTS